MEGSIPTIEIAIQFNQHIDAADEGMCPIHYRDFLMQGLDRVMEKAMGAVIEKAGDAHLRELLARRFRITVRSREHQKVISAS